MSREIKYDVDSSCPRNAFFLLSVAASFVPTHSYVYNQDAETDDDDGAENSMALQRSKKEEKKKKKKKKKKRLLE